MLFWLWVFVAYLQMSWITCYLSFVILLIERCIGSLTIELCYASCRFDPYEDRSVPPLLHGCRTYWQVYQNILVKIDVLRKNRYPFQNRKTPAIRTNPDADWNQWSGYWLQFFFFYKYINLFFQKKKKVHLDPAFQWSDIFVVRESRRYPNNFLFNFCRINCE